MAFPFSQEPNSRSPMQVGIEQLSVGMMATGPQARPSNTKFASCMVEGDAVRVSETASTPPTSATGKRYKNDAEFFVGGSENLTNFRVVLAAGSASAVLNIEYYA